MKKNMIDYVFIVDNNFSIDQTIWTKDVIMMKNNIMKSA